MKAPCKDCKERYLGCHDRCERYQAVVRATAKTNEKKRKEKFIQENYRSWPKK